MDEKSMWNELHELLRKPYTLNDLSIELDSIAGTVLVLEDMVEPVARPEGNPSAMTIERAFESVYHHLMRVSDNLMALQQMVDERNMKQKGGAQQNVHENLTK